MKVLIVGGGLSGLCIGHHLDDNNIPFKIIDRGVNYSTAIAGGMINPITFRRMVKTWRCDDFIPFIKEYYPRIEQKINHSFFHPIKLRRIHTSEDEVKMWEEKVDNPEFSDYIEPQVAKEEIPSYANAPLGSAFINTPGYLDAKSFLAGNHQFFLEKGNLVIEEFSYDNLNVADKTYKGESFTHIVFAEGFQGEDNPYFYFLHFKNAKGEMLTLTSDELLKDEIINRKCYVLPHPDGTFKLGSTYVWNTKDPSPTLEAKEKLLSLYNDMSSAPVEVVDHEAGIRPVAADRRPMIGEHPEHKGLYVFNGLGAKGFTYGPYFAVEFVEFLLGKGGIDDEVSIQRFLK